MAKYKPGQFISTPFGRMRVRKNKRSKVKSTIKTACAQCDIKRVSDCIAFVMMHKVGYRYGCHTVAIPLDCHLEKV